MAHIFLGHDEAYDELVSVLGQVQVVVVCVVIYQSFVCTTPASENVSDLHVMGFHCDDISAPLLLPKAEHTILISHKNIMHQHMNS
jgi:hypothetical protein